MASVDALEGEKDNRAFAAWRSEGRLPSRMAWINVTGSARTKGLEPAFQETLRGLAGSWMIESTEGLVGGWWLLVFRRDDGFERTLLLSPVEQSADVLRESVQEAFRTVPPRTVSGPQMLPPGVTHERRAALRR